ncbi:hypothetical protein ABZP36_010644 [Zizania latifolia]
MASSRRRGARPDRVTDNWERLVRAALKQQHRAPSAPLAPGVGLASAVPPSLGRTTNIEQILQAADDIEDENPNVARIRNLLPPFPSSLRLPLSTRASGFPLLFFLADHAR